MIRIAIFFSVSRYVSWCLYHDISRYAMNLYTPTLYQKNKNHFWNKKVWLTNKIDGLVQERRNSIAIAMELHLSCTKPSRYSLIRPIRYRVWKGHRMHFSKWFGIDQRNLATSYHVNHGNRLMNRWMDRWRWWQLPSEQKGGWVKNGLHKLKWVSSSCF